MNWIADYGFRIAECEVRSVDFDLHFNPKSAFRIPKWNVPHSAFRNGMFRNPHSAFRNGMFRNPQFIRGFTLVEMIMVIVITGIISGMVAMFLRAPIDQYMDVSRRAELTDIADLALYLLASDISAAVPNSVRIAACGGTPCAIEFLPIKSGGRYRAKADSTDNVCPNTASDDDVLSFASPDTCFEIIGTPITFASGVEPAYAGADWIVVGSTQSDGMPPYDTSASGVLRAYTGVGGARSRVDLPEVQFPAFAELESQRFDVVDGAQQAVTYACVGVGTDSSGNGSGQLKRYWKYGFHTSQQAPPTQALVPPNDTPVRSTILADKVSGCVIDYAVANQRLGLLAVHLTLTSNNESVSLYKEIHVNNLP